MLSLLSPLSTRSAQNRSQRKLPQRDRVTAGEIGDQGGLRSTTASQLSSRAIRLGDSAVRFLRPFCPSSWKSRERRLKGSSSTMTDCCAISADHHRRHSTPSSVTKSSPSADFPQRVCAPAQFSDLLGVAQTAAPEESAMGGSVFHFFWQTK